MMTIKMKVENAFICTWNYAMLTRNDSKRYIYLYNEGNLIYSGLCQSWQRCQPYLKKINSICSVEL